MPGEPEAAAGEPGLSGPVWIDACQCGEEGARFVNPILAMLWLCSDGSSFLNHEAGGFGGGASGAYQGLGDGRWSATGTGATGTLILTGPVESAPSGLWRSITKGTNSISTTIAGCAATTSVAPEWEREVLEEPLADLSTDAGGERAASSSHRRVPRRTKLTSFASWQTMLACHLERRLLRSGQDFSHASCP